MRLRLSSLGMAAVGAAIGCLVGTSPATAAPRIGAIGDGVHGVAFVEEEGSKMAYALQIAATSADTAAVAPKPVPGDLPARTA